MQKFLVFLALLISLPAAAQKQATVNDTLQFKRVFGGYKILLHNKALKNRDVKDLMQAYPPAFKAFRTTRFYNTSATLLGIAGGVLIAIPIGTAIAGGDANWNLAYAGGAMVAVTIPLGIFGRKKALKSVKRYNEYLINPDMHAGEAVLLIGIFSTGPGILFHF